MLVSFRLREVSNLLLNCDNSSFSTWRNWLPCFIFSSLRLLLLNLSLSGLAFGATSIFQIDVDIILIDFTVSILSVLLSTSAIFNTRDLALDGSRVLLSRRTAARLLSVILFPWGSSILVDSLLSSVIVICLFCIRFILIGSVACITASVSLTCGESLFILSLFVDNQISVDCRILNLAQHVFIRAIGISSIFGQRYTELLDLVMTPSVEKALFADGSTVIRAESEIV